MDKLCSRGLFHTHRLLMGYLKSFSNAQRFPGFTYSPCKLEQENNILLVLHTRQVVTAHYHIKSHDYLFLYTTRAGVPTYTFTTCILSMVMMIKFRIICTYKVSLYPRYSKDNKIELQSSTKPSLLLKPHGLSTRMALSSSHVKHLIHLRQKLT